MFVSTYPYNYMVHLTDVHVHASIQLYGTAYRCSCPRIHTIIWYSLQMFMSTYPYNYMVQLACAGFSTHIIQRCGFRDHTVLIIRLENMYIQAVNIRLCTIIKEGEMK